MHPITANGDEPARTPIHRDRNLLSVLVGIVGLMTLWGIALSYATKAGDVGRYINGYAILLIMFSPLAVLTPIYGWAGVIDAFAWIARKPGGGRGARDAVTFFQLAAAFAMAFGFINAMVGMVIALVRAGGMPKELGAQLAMALLSQLYGVLVAVISIAMAAYIARRQRYALVRAMVGRRAASVAGLTVIAGSMTTLVVFGILMLSAMPAW